MVVQTGYFYHGRGGFIFLERSVYTCLWAHYVVATPSLQRDSGSLAQDVVATLNQRH